MSEVDIGVSLSSHWTLIVGRPTALTPKAPSGSAIKWLDHRLTCQLLDRLASQLASIVDTAVGKDHEAASKREAKLLFGFRRQRPARTYDFPNAIEYQF
jgi:hypothetical protein